jgi:SOS response regulatory protein OraA/RecX
MFGRSRKKQPTAEEIEAREIKDPARAKTRTMTRAVNLLAAKPRSVEELRERLMEKPWTNSEIVAEVIETLERYKYLDDKQYAADLAASKLRGRPQGKRKLQQTMSRKKLDREVVEEAIRTAFENNPEEDLIDVAIQRRLRLKGAPETREETKKFYDHLMRQGFSYGLIRDKMSRVSKDDFESDID